VSFPLPEAGETRPSDAPEEAATAPLAAVPDDPPPKDEPDATVEGELDIFDTDPFFNPESPAEPSPLSGPSSKAPPEPEPEPDIEPALSEPPSSTAEELLLDTITDRNADTPDVPVPGIASAQPEPATLDDHPAATRDEAEAAVDQAMRDLSRMKTRLADLESELTAAREQAAREVQARKAEAARHAMLENEWSRKTSDIKTRTLARDEALLKGTPMHFSAPVIGGIVLTGLLVTGSALLIGRSWGLRDSLKTDALPPSPVRQATDDTPAPAPLMPDRPGVEKPSAPAWPVLSGGGFKTMQSDRVLTIKFDCGVFARGTILSDAARKDLKQIADALKPSLGRFRLEVEGHTDATPVSSGQPHTNNRELGLARAKAVTEYLSRTCGLPATSLASTSAGDARPPYPNTTPEGQRRNRTVLLKLTPLEE
jgi:flagellar motor protein MotB